MAAFGGLLSGPLALALGAGASAPRLWAAKLAGRRWYASWYKLSPGCFSRKIRVLRRFGGVPLSPPDSSQPAMAGDDGPRQGAVLFLWWPRRPLATLGRKSRQGRKAATVSIDAGAEVSRRGHRLFRHRPFIDASRCDGTFAHAAKSSHDAASRRIQSSPR